MHFLVHTMNNGPAQKNIQLARVVVLFSTYRSGVGDFVIIVGGEVNVRTPVFVRH